MKRWWIGLTCGLVLGWAAQGLAQEEPLLEETPMEASRGAALSIPPDYGRLVNVAVSSEVHHLYFQDGDGTIRVVLVGPSSKAQRARNALQLLSRDVYIIERLEETEVY